MNIGTREKKNLNLLAHVPPAVFYWEFRHSASAIKKSPRIYNFSLDVHVCDGAVVTLDLVND